MNVESEVQKIIFDGFDEYYVSSIYNNYEIEDVDIFEDLGFESIRFINMIVNLESKFGIELPDEYLSDENFGKIGEIEKVIKSLKEKITDEY